MDILLLGNGFDLHYNFPTKYQNFLMVVGWLTNNYNEKIITVADVLGNNELCSKDTLIKQYYNKYRKCCEKIKLNSTDIDKLIKLAKNNIWFKYLFNSYNKDVGWIDFEREISFVCNSFYKFFEYGNFQNVGENKRLKVTLENKNLNWAERSIVIKFFDFWVESHDKIFLSDKSTWARYLVNNEYTLNYPSGSVNVVLNKDKIADFLFNQLKYLSEMLKIYLNNFIEAVSDNLIAEKEIDKWPLVADHVITLNYTKTYEKLYKDAKVYHLHGVTTGPIVLGIGPDSNDDVETIDTIFISFKKYFQRLRFRTDLDYMDFTNTITTSDPYANIHLYVVGHSLDSTDEEVIKQLFEISQDITILCHSLEAIDSYVPNLAKMYGKKGIDRLRNQKKLKFIVTKEELDKVISDIERRHSQSLPQVFSF